MKLKHYTEPEYMEPSRQGWKVAHYLAMITVILSLFPITSKGRYYICQNFNCIAVTDPSIAALLLYLKGMYTLSLDML